MTPWRGRRPTAGVGLSRCPTRARSTSRIGPRWRVAATQWPAVKERKQAEFLVEQSFPWHLIERIGVYSGAINAQVAHALPVGGHRPPVAVLPAWYY